jgi:recombination protein RecR
MARGGGPGGFDMNALLKQAQQMQAEMAKAQEQLAGEEVEASAGGGMVKVKMSGDLKLKSIEIDPEAVDPEDVEMLADMVTAAVNEAIRSAQELANSKMGGITGGLGGLGMAGPGGGGLPGIGQRSAQRLAFHLLRGEDSDAKALADSILEVKEKVGLCELCFNLAEGPRCRICADASRDSSLICVVEEPADVIPIERTHEYRGVYHVLGGALSPIDGIDPEDLKIAELLERARGDEVAEVVLATNPTTTGEATALHIAEALRDQVTVTRLASGLPVGADLEHADEVTLGKALTGRQAL